MSWETLAPEARPWMLAFLFGSFSAAAIGVAIGFPLARRRVRKAEAAAGLATVGAAEARELAAIALRLISVIARLPRCHTCGVLASFQPMPWSRDAGHACERHRADGRGIALHGPLAWGPAVAQLQRGDLDVDRFNALAGAPADERELHACYRRLPPVGWKGPLVRSDALARR